MKHGKLLHLDGKLPNLALRRALLRALWTSYADENECTCGASPEDRCWECEAMAALGLGRWNRDERSLYGELRQLEHDLAE